MRWYGIASLCAFTLTAWSFLWQRENTRAVEHRFDVFQKESRERELQLTQQVRRCVPVCACCAVWWCVAAQVVVMVSSAVGHICVCGSCAIGSTTYGRRSRIS